MGARVKPWTGSSVHNIVLESMNIKEEEEEEEER